MVKNLFPDEYEPLFAGFVNKVYPIKCAYTHVNIPHERIYIQTDPDKKAR